MNTIEALKANKEAFGLDESDVVSTFEIFADMDTYGEHDKITITGGEWLCFKMQVGEKDRTHLHMTLCRAKEFHGKLGDAIVLEEKKRMGLVRIACVKSVG